MDSPLWMRKSGKIFVSHVNAYPRVTLAEGNFNIKWIWWLILWIPVIFFPQLPLSLPSGHMGKVIMVAGIEVLQGLRYRVPLIKANLAMATTECPIRQQQKPTLYLWYGTIPQLISQQSDSRWMTLGHFYNRKGSVLFYSNRYSPRITFTFPECSACSRLLGGH